MKEKVFGNVLTLAKKMQEIASDFIQREKNVFSFDEYIKKIKYKADEKEQNLFSYETFLNLIKKNNFVEADCKTFSVLGYCSLLAKFSIKTNFIFFGKHFDNVSHVANYCKELNFVFDYTNAIFLPFKDYTKLTKYYFCVIC